LLDVNDACKELEAQGLNVRLAVISSSIELEGLTALSFASHVDLLPDPGNDLLPAYLKGADILLLAEGFEKNFVAAIKLSVSSKAHLYMFSHKPIIVYSHPETGIATYARSYDWAKLVTNQNKQELKDAIQQLVEEKKLAECMVAKADKVASTFHTHAANSKVLISGLSTIGFNIKESA
jgi:glycosyltransferase involved in cell wall biosynthesis